MYMRQEKTSERAIAEAVTRGDRKAMHALYDRYVGLAMAVALRYEPDAEEVRDVVQDSFMKVFSAISAFEYRGEGSLKGWILRIVANAAISHVKRRARITFVDDIPDMPDDTDADVLRVSPDVLTRLIGELPDGYRLVLNMYVFGQKSHKEIAARLGIGESTSASQYLRAKKLLASKIKQYIKENG